MYVGPISTSASYCRHCCKPVDFRVDEKSLRGPSEELLKKLGIETSLEEHNAKVAEAFESGRIMPFLDPDEGHADCDRQIALQEEQNAEEMRVFKENGYRRYSAPAPGGVGKTWVLEIYGSQISFDLGSNGDKLSHSYLLGLRARALQLNRPWEYPDNIDPRKH